MGVSQIGTDNVVVRMATTPQEIEAAQHLRYKVFYEEFHAVATPEMRRLRRDFDEYDAIADHLIVVDEAIVDPTERIVGTYRLIRRSAAERFGHFYTSNEFDIGLLTRSDASLLEFGRSCVEAEYRTRPVLQLLWQGISEYMMDHDIDLMFGCASFPGTDPAAIEKELSYLYNFHLSPPALRPRALDGMYVEMDTLPKETLNPKEIFPLLPPLIKGYLRLGATIGHGAIVDHQWNSIDVCIVLPLQQLTDRYRKHYARKVNRNFRGYDDLTIAEGEELVAAVSTH